MPIRRVSDALIKVAKDLYDKGYVSSTGGNISVLQDQIVYITATGTSLGSLDASDIIPVDLKGNALIEGKPSMELPMHLAVYKNRARCKAVIHLHAPYSTALACRSYSNDDLAMPAMTPQYVLKVGLAKRIGYHLPGSLSLAQEVGEACSSDELKGLMLMNHGFLTFGLTLIEAYYAAMEFEENARLVILAGPEISPLNAMQVEEIQKTYGKPTM